MTTVRSAPPPVPTGPLKKWAFTRTGSPLSSILTLQEDLPLPALPDPLLLKAVGTNAKKAAKLGGVGINLSKSSKISSPGQKQEDNEWIRVRVTHSSLNPAGIYQVIIVPGFLRSGGSSQVQTPEFDCAGVVDEVHIYQQHYPSSSSPDDTIEPTSKITTTRFKKGDRVWVHTSLCYWLATGTGALSSHISIPARYATYLPSSVSSSQAAGLGTPTFTAWAAVNESNPQPGDRVLVVAAAGGVGSQAVQMIRTRVGPEGYVVGICKTEAGETVRSLGADDVVDYEKFPDTAAELIRLYGDHEGKEGGRFDRVVDCLGIQSLYLSSRHFTKAGTKYVSVGIKPRRAYVASSVLRTVLTIFLNTVWPLSPWLGGTGRSFKVINEHEPSDATGECEQVVGWLAEGKMRVPVDSIWSWRDVIDAYGVLIGGKAVGKVIIDWTTDDGRQLQPQEEEEAEVSK